MPLYGEFDRNRNFNQVEVDPLKNFRIHLYHFQHVPGCKVLPLPLLHANVIACINIVIHYSTI